ncbi:hypothetical protein GIB67_006800 [Kingdonia uniflora]|uniref:Uncharacterized protein n=1 Tax=Kingdonia uniflora TaxID=39325 RepID=A0A7J7KZZ2_9MAGN|nr:hypothetical protein GIB67_006800 [Kingdonia uniflora]
MALIHLPTASCWVHLPSCHSCKRYLYKHQLGERVWPTVIYMLSILITWRHTLYTYSKLENLL